MVDVTEAATPEGNAHHESSTSPPNNKKRQIDDINGNIHHQTNNNKRRKKNNNKKKTKKNKNQHNHQKKKHSSNNWIENCSESIHRIPSDCTAPLSCVITRVEIEEEPLLPKGGAVVKESIDADGNALAASTSSCSTDANTENADKDTLEKTTTSATHKDKDEAEDSGEKIEGVFTNNIAGPSMDFLSKYAKKVPWKVPSTIQVKDEEKKLFIPVKRHASATGPTKVCLMANNLY